MTTVHTAGAVSVTAAARGLPSDRWRGQDVVVWAIPVVCYFVFPGHLMLGSQVIITALFALSLDVIVGYAGIVSLGHAAFFGLGAYTAAVLAGHGWGEPLLGLVAAAVVAGAVGFATSFLVVRGAALTQLVISLGVVLVLQEIANKASSITGGMDGLTIVTGPVARAFRFDLEGEVAYVYSLLVAFACFLLVRRVVSSPFGLSLRAIREGAARMPALGAPVSRRLTAAYAFAAGLAGIAGALLAQTTQFVALDVISFQRSASVLIMLVLGGAGRLYGGFVGAGMFMVMQDFLARLDPAYWQLWIGGLLVAVVLVGRGGVVGVAGMVRERIRARLAARRVA
jgi:branched-chain amino acid transport system permease protein